MCGKRRSFAVAVFADAGHLKFMPLDVELMVAGNAHQ
jgi:hypothetical protein